MINCIFILLLYVYNAISAFFFWHKQKHYCNVYDYGLGINPP